MYQNEFSSKKTKKVYQKIGIWIAFLSVIGICTAVLFAISTNVHKNNEIQLLKQQIVSLRTECDSINKIMKLQEIKDYMQQINLQNVDIVYAQLLLETGHLTSPLYRFNNNLFGMKPSNKRPTTNISVKGYAKYMTWQESVLDYALWQTKYAHNLSKTEYLQFLARYYAEDKEYINKLKSLLK